MMSRTFLILLMSSHCLVACEPAAQPVPTPTLLVETRTWSADERVSIPITSNLLVHRANGAVLAMTPNGIYGLGVERLNAEPLIRMASAGKDLLTSNGWTVETEQHFEHAIFVRAFRKGGLQGRLLRELWWVQRSGGAYRCDGTAVGEGIAYLGKALRETCQAVGFDGEGVEDGVTP